MIAVPIARWVIGDSIIPTLASLTVVLQFLAVFSLAVIGWGLRRTFGIFLLITLITFSAEYIGSKTGFPFGAYSYTSSLQPQFEGVPIVIPLAWFMMLLPSWAIARLITERWPLPTLRYLVFVVVSAGAFTAWDLFLDPQMVGWGFWRWHDATGGYFGIPWVNYAGWFLTSLLSTMMVPMGRVNQLPLWPLTGIYVIVWLLQTVGLAVFWGQPAPALAGFVIMGLFAVSALWLNRDRLRIWMTRIIR
jgi:putative membrane protein